MYFSEVEVLFVLNSLSDFEIPNKKISCIADVVQLLGAVQAHKKYSSAVGTTCLVSSLALAVQCRTSTKENSEYIICLAIRCKYDPSSDPASVAPDRNHRQIRHGVELQN